MDINNLIHNTILIQVLNEYDKIVSTGTGFTYSYHSQISEKNHFLALITNKHVLENAKKVKLSIPLADENNNVIIGKNYDILIQEKSLQNVFYHPVSDLAMINLSHFYNIAERDNKIKLYEMAIDKSLFITDEELSSLNAMEDIIMIGYPNGLWDTKNNLPLIRKGVTASHPAYDFNGNPEFLIDAACFPGSSGSPVFLYNNGTYYDKNEDTLNFGLRISFIGVLHAGPVGFTDGTVLNHVIELESGDRVISKTMLNLGYVVKASEIFAFDPVFKKIDELYNSKTPGAL